MTGAAIADLLASRATGWSFPVVRGVFDVQLMLARLESVEQVDPGIGSCCRSGLDSAIWQDRNKNRLTGAPAAYMIVIHRASLPHHQPASTEQRK